MPPSKPHQDAPHVSRGHALATFPRLTVELKQVHHRAGPAFALRVGSLSLQSGQLYCVLGPTGSGKSTLLRLLAGVDTPTSGQLRVVIANGEWSLSRLNRQRAAVFQRPVLVSGTVQYNVELGLRFRGVGALQRRNEALAWLRRLEIDHLRDRRVNRLSGGEIRLVAIARALAVRPALLLLDEPTADLDPGRVQRVEQTVRQYCRDAHALVVWTTHQLPQARRIADVIIQLHGGELKRVAGVQDFFGQLTDEELEWLLYS